MSDLRARSGPELAQLTAFLDTQREALLRKAEGLSRAQLAQRHPPSTLTLGGLLNHGALNENWWFARQFLGLPEVEPWASADWDAAADWEMSSAAGLEPDVLRQRYRDACAESRQIVAAAAGLDQQSVGRSRDGEPFDLRWIVLHMIEETARHAGHADLLREAIDGAVGE